MRDFKGRLKFLHRVHKRWPEYIKIVEFDNQPIYVSLQFEEVGNVVHPDKLDTRGHV